MLRPPPSAARPEPIPEAPPVTKATSPSNGALIAYLLLWGFFVNLNLPDAIQSLQARRDAVFKTLNIG